MGILFPYSQLSHQGVDGRFPPAIRARRLPAGALPAEARHPMAAAGIPEDPERSLALGEKAT